MFRGGDGAQTELRSMPQDLRDALRSAVRDAIVAQRQFAEAEEITARQQIEDAGCEVIELIGAERQRSRRGAAGLSRDARSLRGKTVADILGSDNETTSAPAGELGGFAMRL